MTKKDTLRFALLCAVIGLLTVYVLIIVYHFGLGFRNFKAGIEFIVGELYLFFIPAAVLSNLLLLLAYQYLFKIKRFSVLNIFIVNLIVISENALVFGSLFWPYDRGLNALIITLIKAGILSFLYFTISQSLFFYFTRSYWRN